MPFTGPAEDRLAIRELMDTHAHGVMTRDPELWGSIEVEGDSAKAVAYTIELYDDPETGARVHTTGRYDDELRKIDGEWKFTRRAYRIVFAH